MRTLIAISIKVVLMDITSAKIVFEYSFNYPPSDTVEEYLFDQAMKEGEAWDFSAEVDQVIEEVQIYTITGARFRE